MDFTIILLIVVFVFACLHKQVDFSLHIYNNATWGMKGPKGLPIFILIIFFVLLMNLLEYKISKHLPS